MAENVRESERSIQAGQNAAGKAGENTAIQTGQGMGALESAGKRKGLGGLLRSPSVLGILLVLVLGGAYFGYRFYTDAQTKIAIETAEISAPVILVGPETAGILKELYVKEGDHVTAGQKLFNVGDHVTNARVPGIITAVQNTPGQWASNQNGIVQMYDPSSLRVVGHIQEDQGYNEIKVGQPVIFTLDAFGSQQFTGTIESIADTANQSSAVFSISDKRQEKQYNVKATFDANANPQIVNGLSARMWIYK
jgi:multidrug resistance efflux pump